MKYVEYDKMRSYMMIWYNISLHSMCSNSKRVLKWQAVGQITLHMV